MNQTNTFEKRYSLSQFIIDNLQFIFNPDEIEIIPFGFEKIGGNNVALNNFIKTPESNLSHSSMIVKFAPDFILLKKTTPQQLYFLEIKASVTPLYSQNRLDEISNAQKRRVKISDVGDIAREAWNAYNNLFPNTIIIDGCSYNSKLLMAQFVNNIRCLRCYETPSEPYQCNLCPMKNKDFFENGRNFMSSGSQTPHTNIDYSSFMEISDFFKQLGISTNEHAIDNLKNKIKNHGISFSSSIYSSVRDRIIKQLNDEGCNWIK